MEHSMPKRPTKPAPPAPAVSLSIDQLLRMAREASADEPADDYVGRSLRARSFMARIIGTLPDVEGNALAEALNMPHLATTAEEVAS
jgi:hypothetical protein